MSMTGYQQEVWGEGRYDPKGGVVLQQTKSRARQKIGGKKKKVRQAKGGSGMNVYERQLELFGRQWLWLLLLSKRAARHGMAGVGGGYTIHDKSETAREMRYV